MIMLIGGQGAGKSTFYKQMFFDTHIRVSLDQLRTRHRERLLVEACVQMKQKFVVDNTNPTVEERAKYLAAAARGGFTAVAYYFESPLDMLLQRNSLRTGTARIPDIGVRGTFKRLERPSPAEGFMELYRVYPGQDFGFTVTREFPNEV